MRLPVYATCRREKPRIRQAIPKARPHSLGRGRNEAAGGGVQGSRWRQPKERAMAINVRGSRKGAIADINVTPMADVMIVLLIIFMVMTPLLASSPVPLPPAAHSKERGGEALTVVVKASGEIGVGETSFAGADAFAEYMKARMGPGDATPLLLL